VRETQQALNITRESVEKQAQSVANDNRLNSKMLMNFEKNMGDVNLEVRELKDSQFQMRKVVTGLGEQLQIF